MFTLKNGDTAPEVELVDCDGETWRLSDYIGKMVVLHFGRGEYCHTTRGEFALWSSFHHIFQGMNAEVAFVVNGGREEHRLFRDQHTIRPRILIDEDGAVGDAYGIYGVNSREMNRDNYRNYTAPSVYLIDAGGRVSCFWLLSGPRGRPSPECLLGILALAKDRDWTY